MFEAEAEAKILASRPLCSRGLNITGFYRSVYDISYDHYSNTLTAAGL